MTTVPASMTTEAVTQAQITTLTNNLATTTGNVTTLQTQKLTVAGTFNTTSGLSIDVTPIPSWVKRITVGLNGVSTNGTSVLQVQVGSGSVQTSGYAVAASDLITGTITTGNFTAGFALSNSNAAAYTASGVLVLTLIGTNTWAAMGNFFLTSSRNSVTGGAVTLSGTLDRLRLTTVSGSDTFDAGSFSVLYE